MKRKLAKQQTKTVIILVNAQHITVNKRANCKRNVKQIMTGTMFMRDERQGATFKHQLLTNRMRNWVKNCCETDTIELISSLNLERHFAVWMGTCLFCVLLETMYTMQNQHLLLCFRAMMTKYELLCNIAWIKHV